METCFLEGVWERIILRVAPPIFTDDKEPPHSAGVYSLACHGKPHSQSASVNNAPNNYVTVFGLPREKVSPPSLAVLQYANGEEKRAEV